MMLPSRRRLLQAGLGLCAGLPGAAAAQEPWPGRPLRLLIGFSPGGAVDAVARVVAEEMGNGLGQAVIVENKTGASGNIASTEVARSRPDGYTLMLGNGPQLAINQHLFRDMQVRPDRDFAPIGQAATVRFVAVVNARYPAATLRAFVAATETRETSYGTSGVGTVQHLGTEQLIAASGAKITHIPFRGSGQLINDVIAGHVDFTIDAESVVTPHIRSGALRGLAIMATARSADLPDVPTVQEAGYGEIVVEGWQGLVAPAATSPDVLRRLGSELKRTLEAPAVRQRLQAMAIIPLYRDAAEFQRFLEAERARWGALVTKLGIQL